MLVKHKRQRTSSKLDESKRAVGAAARSINSVAPARFDLDDPPFVGQLGSS